MPAAGAGPGEVQRGRPGLGITALLVPDLAGHRTDVRGQVMETALSPPTLRPRRLPVPSVLGDCGSSSSLCCRVLKDTALWEC